MKVSLKMVDKQLRLRGFLLNLISTPTLKAFKRGWKFSQRFKGNLLKGFKNEELWIPRSEGNSEIRLRIFKPQEIKGKLPVLLYCHGGGYAMNVPEMEFPQIGAFLKERDCVIVAPDYRKSLEEPYPAALNDCYDTLKWIKENASDLGIRTDQIMVGGFSAGGGLTAAVSLLARDRKELNISFQMPIYPMIDDRMITESSRDNNAPVWDGKLTRLGWDLYLQDLQKEGKPIPEYAAPARASDYSNLPPTATYVGSLEPFRDETIEYVENLRKEGIPVEFKVFEKCFHGFDVIAPKARVSKQATRFILDCFNDAIDNHFAEQHEIT